MADMKFTHAVADDQVEILYNSAYVGDAVTLGTAAFSDGLCKAGTAITADGKKATGSDAAGILLHDVVEARPQATIVVGGYINTKVAEAHAGSIAEAVKTALKNVVFM